jgi:hypothetical protein
MFLEISFIVSIHGLECLLGWVRLQLSGRFGYVEIINKFNNKNCSLLQVIYRCTGILCLWSPLQRMENRDLFMEVCTQLKATARDTFFLHGWPHNLRIEAPPSP